MKTRHLVLLLVLLFALLFVPGCRGSGKAAGTGAVLRYPLTLEPPTLDPARLNDIYVTEMMQNVYEGLVTFDARNRIVPALAEKWEVTPDGKTYTFHLRSNARFHNGRAVTAADFVFSFARALRPETVSPTASNYLAGIVGAAEVAAGRERELRGVTSVDDRTLRIALDKPRGYFLGCLTYPCAWVVCKEVVPQNASAFDSRAAVGSGPFRLAEYRSGSSLIMESNQAYWGGAPKLARIERPIVIDPTTAHIMFENGEVDASNNISVADYVDDSKSASLRSQLRLLPQANIYYMVMHQKLEPAFAKIKVRRAFAMAIDRERVASLAFHGTCPAAYSFVPPGMPGENANIRKLPYDPAGGRKLLAEAGYPGGKGFPRMTLEYAQKQRELADSALIIRDNLKENLGIEIDVHEHEMGTFFDDTANHERIAFYLTGWIADYLDPQDFLSTLLRTGAPINHVGYSNPIFDRLCDEADALSDMEKRIPLYQQADQIAMDDVAILPIVFFQQPQLVKPYVKNLDNNLMLPMLPHKRTAVAR